MEVPDVRSARAGGVAVAYQVVGEGSHDLVFSPHLADLDSLWLAPFRRRFLDRVAAEVRLVVLQPAWDGPVRSAPKHLFSAPTYPRRCERLVLLQPFPRARDPRALDWCVWQRWLAGGLRQRSHGSACRWRGASPRCSSPFAYRHSSSVVRTIAVLARDDVALVPDSVLATVLFTDLVGSTASRRARGPSLAGTARRALPSRTPGAGALPRYRDRQCRRRVLLPPRRASASNRLRAGDPRHDERARARGARRHPHGSVRGDRREARRDRLQRRVADSPARRQQGKFWCRAPAPTWGGLGFAFEGRRERELKGVPGTWRLYAVVDG